MFSLRIRGFLSGVRTAEMLFAAWRSDKDVGFGPTDHPTVGCVCTGCRGLSVYIAESLLLSEYYLAIPSLQFAGQSRLLELAACKSLVRKKIAA